MTSELHSLIIYILFGYSLLYPAVLLCLRLFSIEHPLQRVQIYLLALVIPPAGFVLYHTLLTKRCQASPYGLAGRETLHLLCYHSTNLLGLIMPLLGVLTVLGILKAAAAWLLITRLRARSATPAADLLRRIEITLRTRCLSMNISQPELIFSSKSGYSAFTAGFFRPVLVINTSLADQLKNHELDILITHELVHIKKRDTLKGWLLQLFKNLTFINPLSHMLLGRFFLERECLCDRSALKLTGLSAQTYVAALLKIWRLQLTEKSFRPWTASAFSGRSRETEYRIGSLIKREAQNRLAPLPFFALLISLLTGSIIFLGLIC